MFVFAQLVGLAGCTLLLTHALFSRSLRVPGLHYWRQVLHSSAANVHRRSAPSTHWASPTVIVAKRQGFLPLGDSDDACWAVSFDRPGMDIDRSGETA